MSEYNNNNKDYEDMPDDLFDIFLSGLECPNESEFSKAQDTVAFDALDSTWNLNDVTQPMNGLNGESKDIMLTAAVLPDAQPHDSALHNLSPSLVFAELERPFTSEPTVADPVPSNSRRPRKQKLIPKESKPLKLYERDEHDPKLTHKERKQICKAKKTKKFHEFKKSQISALTQRVKSLENENKYLKNMLSKYEKQHTPSQTINY